jgi:hypothetical protein
MSTRGLLRRLSVKLDATDDLSSTVDDDRSDTLIQISEFDADGVQDLFNALPIVNEDQASDATVGRVGVGDRSRDFEHVPLEIGRREGTEQACRAVA